MSFKPGQSIIFIVPADGKIPAFITSMVVRKSNKQETLLECEEYPRFTAFLYPDTPACREFLQAGIDMSKRHKQEEDEYMSRTYQLNNQLVRDGLK